MLGILLLDAGMELALVCRDVSERNEVFVMLFTAVTGLAFKFSVLGFACGLALHYLLRATAQRTTNKSRTPD